jgi:hypothetical protein
MNIQLLTPLIIISNVTKFFSSKFQRYKSSLKLFNAIILIDFIEVTSSKLAEIIAINKISRNIIIYAQPSPQRLVRR